MGIDASIYSQIKPVEMPSPLDSAQKAMSLSQMGMQQQAQQYQMAQLQATRQAYAQNTDPTGKIDMPGAISTLSRMGFGPQAQELGSHYAAQQKAQAEAQSAQMEAQQKIDDLITPRLQYLKEHVPPDQQATVYHNIVGALADQGVPVHNVPPEFSGQWLDQTLGTLANRKQFYDAQAAQAGVEETKAKTAEAWANAGMTPLKRQELTSGRSSPNATISNQYADDPAVKAAKSSQVYMNQMMDAFRKPGPYSDESLALNAMKIKFPGAPDVGSLEEFKNAQGATDAMKSYVSKKLEGLKSDEDRKNLMRDAVSTYLPNVQTLRGAQKKYLQKATGQGVPNAADIVAEPGIDQTEAEVRALNKELGPYKPPAQREGSMLGRAANALSKMTGGEQGAAASSGQPPAEPMIRIKAPDGKIYQIPRSKKGAAIAAGGSVVK